MSYDIEPDAHCVVCKVKNSVERPLDWVCSECGGVTHTECGMDAEPSVGQIAVWGWDRDRDKNEVNYWVCRNCIKAYADECNRIADEERAAEQAPYTIAMDGDMARPF